MKLQPNKRKYSNNGKRFYTSRDMAIFKHDDAVLNSKAKRGEIELKNNHSVIDCGCGNEGCFISITRSSEPKKTVVEVIKNRYVELNEDKEQYESWLKNRAR